MLTFSTLYAIAYLSVCPSRGWISRIGLSSVLRPRQHSIGYIGDVMVDQSKKRSTLGLRNFHHTHPSSFLVFKFHPEILTGSPEWGRQTREGWDKQAINTFKQQYLENGN